MHKEHQIFSLSRPIFWFFVALNIGLAFWLDFNHGSAFGWFKFILSVDKTPGVPEFLSIFQFLLFAFTLDQYFRRAIRQYNLKAKQRRIPAILVQLITILTYAIVGLAGFILLYDKSISTLLAFSSAIGLALAYVARDMIADMSASVQLQTDRLIAIDEWLEILDGASPGIYQVLQMDRQMITLRNSNDQRVKLPNKRFLGLTYINLSREENGSRRRVDIQIETPHSDTDMIALLEASLESLYQSNHDFFGLSQCEVKQVQSGHVVYSLLYHCKPDLKHSQSDHQVLRMALRFIRASGNDLSSHMNVKQISSDYPKKSRLWDLYDFGILRALSKEELMQLVDKVEERRIKHGEQLIQAGQLADSMYIIAEGVLDVSVKTADGQSKHLAKLWPGDCVGEMSLLTGEPRSADVYAHEDSILLEITKEELAPLLESNQDLADALSGQMIERVAHQQKILAENKKLETPDSLRDKLTKKILGFFGLVLMS